MDGQVRTLLSLPCPSHILLLNYLHKKWEAEAYRQKVSMADEAPFQH